MLAFVAPLVVAPLVAFATPTPTPTPPTTGPDTPVCVEATARVAIAAQESIKATDALAAVQKNLATAQDAVDKAANAVVKAKEALATDPLNLTKQAALTKALADLKSALDAYVKLIDPVKDIELGKAVVDARTALEVAITNKLAACKEPTPPTTTTTAPPTTTTTTPPPSTTTPQITTIPEGGVETGDGSLAN